jgi:hypothetical protein
MLAVYNIYKIKFELTFTRFKKHILPANCFSYTGAACRNVTLTSFF